MNIPPLRSRRCWMCSPRHGVVSNKIGNFLFKPAPSGGSYYDQAEKWFIRK